MIGSITSRDYLNVKQQRKLSIPSLNNIESFSKISRLESYCNMPLSLNHLHLNQLQEDIDYKKEEKSKVI